MLHRWRKEEIIRNNQAGDIYLACLNAIEHQDENQDDSSTTLQSITHTIQIEMNYKKVLDGHIEDSNNNISRFNHRKNQIDKDIV